MRRLTLLRRLEKAFPHRPREIFFRWMGEDLNSTLGYTIQRDDQGLTVSFTAQNGTVLDPADPLVAGYWTSRKEIPNGDTLEAFKSRAACKARNKEASQKPHEEQET